MKQREWYLGGRRALWGLAVVVLVLGSCTSKPAGAPGAAYRRPSAPGGSGSPTGGGVALVASLPGACDARVPGGAAVVTFVAGGRAWAVSPDDVRTLVCLFEVPGPGAFSWGPRGDRVALTGLEVRGVGTSISRPQTGVKATYFSWSRPTGTTVIFTKGDRHGLYRADMGTPNTREITPITDETYGDMAYHPSGLANVAVVSSPRSTARPTGRSTRACPARCPWSAVSTPTGSSSPPAAAGSPRTSTS